MRIRITFIRITMKRIKYNMRIILSTRIKIIRTRRKTKTIRIRE